MNWSGIGKSIFHTKSLVNAALVFFAGYGFAVMFHLPGHWYFALTAVIANQIGLQQQPPKVE